MKAQQVKTRRRNRYGEKEELKQATGGQRVAARKMVVGMRRRKESVLRVGEGASALVEKVSPSLRKPRRRVRKWEQTKYKKRRRMQRRIKVYPLRVLDRWVTGRLSNNAGFRGYVSRQRKSRRVSGGGELGQEYRWYSKHRKGREGWLGSPRSPRPGVLILREVEKQGLARREAVNCGIPTVGRTHGRETKAMVSQRTYWVRSEDRLGGTLEKQESSNLNNSISRSTVMLLRRRRKGRNEKTTT